MRNIKELTPKADETISFADRKEREAMADASHDHLRLIMRSRPTGYLPPIENARG